MSALGAGLYGLGIPKDSVIRYEAYVKADGYLVMARGSDADVARAKALLAVASPVHLDVHTAAEAATPEPVGATT